MKIALLDIGNSTVQLGYFDGLTISDRQGFSTPSFINQLHLLDLEEQDFCVVSSVVPKLNQTLSQLATCYFVTHETVTDLDFNLPTPTQLGADRITNALAVAEQYSLPAIIIDSGTALTFCHIDQNRQYQGGVILPGMGIASKALHDYTAQIPQIHVEKQAHLVGKTTKEAVQIGLYQGYLAMINGLISQYRAQLPGVQIIGTGSGLDIYKDQLQLDAFDDDLIFKGLAAFANTCLKSHYPNIALTSSNAE